MQEWCNYAKKQLNIRRMFLLKLRAVSSCAFQTSFGRPLCCWRNVNFNITTLGSVRIPGAKFEARLTHFDCTLLPQHRPWSSSAAGTVARLAEPAYPRLSNRTSGTFHQTRHPFISSTAASDFLASPLGKMAEVQRQSFRKKHNKRQRNLTGNSEQGGGLKLDRNGNVSVQVIGSGTADCPPSVLVIAASVRFLFNCGEGTQRLMFENRVKNMSRLEHIFFTRMTWENLGGSIGMMITLKNVGLPKLSLYGPPQLEEFSKALQIFAKHETIKMDVKPYTDGSFLNEIMAVTPIAIHSNSQKGHISPPSSPSTSHQADSPSAEGLSGSDEEGLEEEEEGSGNKRKAKDPFDIISKMAVQQQGAKRRKMELEDLTIAYVCKLHDTPGRIIVKKALDLGLRPGPAYSILKGGKSVTTDDGVEIKPEDVMDPGTPGITFIVLECPSEEFVESVTKNEGLARHQADASDSAVSLVIHMCPETVLNDNRYQSWMCRFGPATEHIVLNSTCRTVTHESCRRLQAKLNLVHPGIFPLLPVHEASSSTQAIGDNSSPIMKDAKVCKAESYMRYHLRPHTGWDREFIQSPSNEPFIQEAMAVPGFKDTQEELVNQLEQRPSVETAKYPELVFFGTGSAMPNKERNVTGILLNVSQKQSMILDCGEGTFGQLQRFYGDRTDNVLANLQSIFVSHIHADHHGGLMQILREWRRVKMERGDINRDLILVGPKRMLIWLNNYHTSCESFIQQMRFVELQSLSGKLEDSSRHEQSLLARLDLTEYKTVPVPHCFNSHGLVIKHKDGWKLVYSGDCMPSHNLIHAGKDADVLIHEATLEDGLDAEAVKKRHSMISQAIDVGQKMDAKFILLTHFSQRYPKIPFFNEEFSHRVGLAFDNMRVSFSELDQLPLCLPALKKLFTEYIQEMQGNRNKRVEKETVLNLESLLKGGKVIVSETDSNEKQENAKGQSLHIVPETDSTTNEEQENAEGQTKSVS
ncbi:zinc phosphodiesterase ELAC protein 2-like isoform X1 [Asterias rubens]|uniref:zinc phosphodiesterase ELAC protein 2-like isoform X1 n=1 Tax=Asterias rubens TaxID=7604 RepID=UPI001455566D|nr:zinc phosphodiesterase ELAC protein 2-like isoform X1 [Asterias rubens]